MKKQILLFLFLSSFKYLHTEILAAAKQGREWGL